MDRESAPDDVFETWKRAVGLAATFPRLLPIDQPIRPVRRPGQPGFELDERIVLPHAQAEAIERIVLMAGQPQLGVRVALGHGCTTISRIVAAQLEGGAVMRGLIPVHVSVEQMGLDPDLPPDDAFRGVGPDRVIDAITGATHEAVVRSLVTQPWERVVGRPTYAHLVAAPRADDQTLVEHRRALAAAQEGSGRAVGDLAPRLAEGELRPLVQELDTTAKVRVVLLLDLSPTPVGRVHETDGGERLEEGFIRVALSVASAVKILDQGLASFPMRTSVDVMVFGCDEVMHILRSEYLFLPEMVDVEWYRPIDVFAMLAHHYPLRRDPWGGETAILAAVLDSGFLGGIDRSTALDTAMEGLERDIRSQLTSSGLQYHVTSAPKAPARTTSPRPGVGAPPARGRPVEEEFDVFLCHSSADRVEVRALADQLRGMGLVPWLDVEQLRPGRPWQEELERQIGTIRSAAVCVGASGMGPWQRREMRAFLEEFVDRDVPVVPVLLESAPGPPVLPIFLRGFEWVDLRDRASDPLARLHWGITGTR